jgi:hypothetical protein
VDSEFPADRMAHDRTDAVLIGHNVKTGGLPCEALNRRQVCFGLCGVPGAARGAARRTPGRVRLGKKITFPQLIRHQPRRVGRLRLTACLS